MTPDTLRRAATLMREQHGPEHERHAMWSAMADWLDEYATHAATPYWQQYDGMHHAFTVARAYIEAVA